MKRHLFHFFSAYASIPQVSARPVREGRCGTKDGVSRRIDDGRYTFQGSFCLKVKAQVASIPLLESVAFHELISLPILVERHSRLIIILDTVMFHSAEVLCNNMGS